MAKLVGKHLPEKVESLTPREAQVMSMLLDGASLKEVARQLGTEESTIKSHRDKVFRKYEVNKITQLAKRVFEAAKPPHGAPELSGYWLSRFDFQSHVPDVASPELRFRRGEQINLEVLEPIERSFFNYRGRSVCGKRDNGLRAYEHELHVLVAGDIAVGIWRNSNSNNVGCFQTFIHGEASAMWGSHLGNTSAHVVKAGGWIWMKASAPKDFKPDPSRFRSFEELTRLLDEVRDNGRPLAVTELFR